MAIGGLQTSLNIRAVYTKDQIQVFSREAALAGQVRVDCDTQFVIRVFTSEEDVALSIHVPASGSHSAEGVTAAVSSLIGALIDGQSYHIAINLNIRSFYLAEVRICGTTIIQGEVGSCQLVCIYILFEGYGNFAYLVAVEVLNDRVLNVSYLLLQSIALLDLNQIVLSESSLAVVTGSILIQTVLGQEVPCSLTSAG